MNTLKLKKGDLVKVTTGSLKGKTGKVVAVLPKEHAVKVEGLNIVKRHVKPNMLNPQGGVSELHRPIDVSKLALVIDAKTGATSRIGMTTKKDGSRVRTATQAKNKEIDS